MDSFMVFITTLGNNGYIWIAIGLLMIISRKYRKLGILLLLGLLMDLIIGNLILKNLVARPRPSWIDTSVKLLIDNPRDYSFPSGHTMTSISSAVILAMANRKFGLISIPLAVLISVSRLYLYVHFPSDVLMGAIIGFLIGYFITFYDTKRSISKLANESKRE